MFQMMLRIPARVSSGPRALGQTMRHLDRTFRGPLYVRQDLPGNTGRRLLTPDTRLIR